MDIFLQLVGCARGPRLDRPIREIIFHISSQLRGCAVSSVSVFFKRLQSDPVQVATQQADQVPRFGPACLGPGYGHIWIGTDPRAWWHWIGLPQLPQDLIKPLLLPLRGVERQ